MSLQDTDLQIIKAVTDHYETHESPYYLAELGKFFRDNHIPVPEGVRFKDYLKSRFHERLIIVQDEENPARIAIAPPENKEAVLQQLSGQSSVALDDSHIDYTRLPFALIAAFCRIPLPDTQVYFRTIPPFRYQVQKKAPEDGYIEIGEKFRLTSFAGKSVYELSPSDKRSIFQQIEKWAEEKSLDLRDFYYDSGSRSIVREKVLVETGDNALQRLLNAQNHELRRRLQIPGDIADVLMRLP